MGFGLARRLAAENGVNDVFAAAASIVAAAQLTATDRQNVSLSNSDRSGGGPSGVPMDVQIRPSASADGAAGTQKSSGGVMSGWAGI